MCLWTLNTATMPLPFLQIWQFINIIKYSIPKFSYTFSLEFIFLKSAFKLHLMTMYYN